MLVSVLVGSILLLGQGALGELFALDGQGNPVSWWFVLKLPWQTRNAKGEYIDTPCDCPRPDCSNVNVEIQDERKFGLCYLYADANNSTLRYFRDVGFDCLGQGGNDPVSQTLRAGKNATYWAYFNDQYNGIAEKQDKKRTCSADDGFNAHAKGAVAFEADTGGFILQTSTPNFPDPTIASSDEQDDFVRLGCQHDNNVEYSQHLFAMSVGSDGIDLVGNAWHSARLCSANHYDDMVEMLASPALRQNKEHAVADALVNAEAVEKPSINVTFTTKGSRKVSISAVVKNKQSEVPPWAMVASAFESDLSVASWWDEGYGIPTLCDGDKYDSTPHNFCLTNNPIALRQDGTFPYNVENLMEASLTLPSKSKLSWSLRGGRVRDGNHGKWALATPRHGQSSGLSIFGDMNMEGYPCSKTCSGSQGGRGGSFYGIQDADLHKSLVELITDVCKCSPTESSTDTFVQFRMCSHGCIHKIESFFTPEELPLVSNSSSSFWGHRCPIRHVIYDEVASA
ncbi:unnamed protein product [Aphanomyces euteiches]|uniref:Uncharacterized protein n=1 Tax=Aphanomyces euteiches TaxID=100861 RepID=A0A6G0XFR3_9STRA|nr:hypothetical protein Ae201684_005216 [Aphanomyces euteiches]KAH9053442.1 hypothetical protein Ae201684P_015211 [Aphanomyces euteiches]KAH9134347.1 hypothetical protein AeRB84_019800 [Aphanomyces euteiches]